MENDMKQGVFPVRNPLLLIGCVVLTNLAGFIGSFFTDTGAGSWYADVLVKPWFVPPDVVFPIAWTAIFILMGIALYLILMEGTERPDVQVAAGLFLCQLLLNILWSYAFFTLQSPFFGFIEILILWLFILAVTVSFYRINTIAGYLFIPYLAWVSFAAILNGTIYLLN
ncbi:TspO/MBR family protein [Methanogenium organophilum]|uniref:Tryptophan-rich sensory protein n=1 Tax=Methanogenium organophilum TaxID=2199 RepID=A0A9X9T8T8_METOG|nr:TspO/MBR family protein [Methanogenium organophilum]WAI01497.1 tryptophan-rich sensory protein [Methanogenium organophilum]